MTKRQENKEQKRTAPRRRKGRDVSSAAKQHRKPSNVGAKGKPKHANKGLSTTNNVVNKGLADNKVKPSSPKPQFDRAVNGLWVTDVAHNVNKFWIANDPERTVPYLVVCKAILNGLSDAQPELCRFSEVIKHLDEGDIILANLALEEYWSRFSKDHSSLLRELLKACSSAAIKKVVTPDSYKAAYAASIEAFYRDDEQLDKIDVAIFDRDSVASDALFPDVWNQISAMEREISTNVDTRYLTTRTVLRNVREFCHYALGAAPSPAEIAEHAKHGPGATQTVSGAYTSTFYKDSSFSAYPHSISLLSAVLSYDQHFWEAANYDIRRMGAHDDHILRPLLTRDIGDILVKANPIATPDKVVFVGKDWKSLRPILPGKTLNVYVQLGVGVVMDNRLRLVGLDIHDQERNKLLARRGSASGRFATVDLSNASGLICTELVRAVLPGSWFNLLDTLRCRAIERVGKDRKKETYQNVFFSGMGNGYTFPLETVIFAGAVCAAYALAGYSNPVLEATRAFRCGKAAVYGDDIIVQTELVPHLYTALYHMGARVNVEKSFTKGPFRESCGGDYYLGHDIRPPFVRSNDDGGIPAMNLIAVHNGYAELMNRQLADGGNFGITVGADAICARIRQIWTQHIHPILPTSTDGRGFTPVRTMAYCSHSIVPEYQRWGMFSVEGRTETTRVKSADPHLLVRAILRGGASTDVQDAITVSLRGTYRVRMMYDRVPPGSRFYHNLRLLDLLRQIALRKRFGIL